MSIGSILRHESPRLKARSGYRRSIRHLHDTTLFGSIAELDGPWKDDGYNGARSRQRLSRRFWSTYVN